MKFVRKNPFPANCSFHGYELELVDNFLDLGVLLDSKLNFIPYKSMTVNKARSVLNFIKWWAKGFNDPYVTKSLYTSLVWPILEYESIIWDPLYKKYSSNIHRISTKTISAVLSMWTELFNI